MLDHGSLLSWCGLSTHTLLRRLPLFNSLDQKAKVEGMITKQQYVEYLISTATNYTGSHLAEHLDDVSHDVITDYLRAERLTARVLPR